MEALTLNAGAGNDTINVNSTAATTPVLINAGGGNDHIEVNTPIGLDGLQGALTVDGQGHQPGTLGDGLELRDDPNPAGHTYTVEAAGITRDGIAPITYVGVEHLGISAGTGNDVFNVRGTPPTPFFMGVNGNKGDDIFNVGSINNTLDTVGPVVVHDIGGGYDQLFINDQGNSTATNYFISENEVNRVSPYMVVQYGPTEPLERVVLNGGSGGNAITVHSLKPGTAFEVNTGAGDDSISMLPGAAAGSLMLDGQGGVNTLDYSAYATDVMVNLTLGTATAVAGGIANVGNVTGGGGHDVLVGAAGKNVLAGGGGRDILIGGVGGDWLDGGADDDLLFDGTTDFDGDPAAPPGHPLGVGRSAAVVRGPGEGPAEGLLQGERGHERRRRRPLDRTGRARLVLGEPGLRPAGPGPVDRGTRVINWAGEAPAELRHFGSAGASPAQKPNRCTTRPPLVAVAAAR